MGKRERALLVPGCWLKDKTVACFWLLDAGEKALLVKGKNLITSNQ
jgi:hypothetical protein